MTSRLQAVVLGLLALLFHVTVFATEVSATLDRSRIAEGETVVLRLVTDGDGSDTPDLTPLAQDFDLLNQSQSTRISIINGHRASSREWQLVLAPKRTGRLQIPPLSISGAHSEALTLEVSAATQTADNEPARPVLLEVEVEPVSPYVQAKVIYRVRLLARVPLHQATLSEPEVGDAIVERLGEDNSYSIQRDGEQYQVVERRYAIFPQHSGTLEIVSPVLSAQVAQPANNRRRNLFGGDPFGNLGGMFESVRPLHLRGRNLTLDVQPQPTGSPTPWLPAESLTLTEAWSPDPPVFRVGEPVTRTLTLRAHGVTAAQLPDLEPAAADGIKLYPDRPQAQTRNDGDTLVAEKILKSALVPMHAGTFELPEVRLAWWDTTANQTRIAVLPARRIQVLAGEAGTVAPTPAPAAVTQQPSPQSGPSHAPGGAGALPSAAQDSDKGQPQAGMHDRPAVSDYWPWVAAIFALAWLVTLVLWWHARRMRTALPADKPMSVSPNSAKALAEVERACRSHDARGARQALLAWATVCWPAAPPRRLDVLAARLGAAAAPILHEIDQSLYAADPQIWDGAAAWQRLAPLLKTGGENMQRQVSPLPPLYPHGT